MLVSPTPETIKETLCLDYANSVEWSSEDEHADVLRTSDMLGRWGRRLGLLSDDAKSASEAELRRARALRDAVYRLFSSISRDQEPARKDLDVLMSNYMEAVKGASLLAGEDFYKLDWPARDPRRAGLPSDVQHPRARTRRARLPRSELSPSHTVRGDSTSDRGWRAARHTRGGAVCTAAIEQPSSGALARPGRIATTASYRVATA